MILVWRSHLLFLMLLNKAIAANYKKSAYESSELLDLYGSAADIKFAFDNRGISNEMDGDLSGVFDE